MDTDVRPELVLSDSGLPCDTFNIICRSRLDGAGVRAAAGDAIARFARAQRPFSWWVGPADQPGDLGSVLEELGLQRAESSVAMALPLASLSGPPAPIPGLEVRRVRTEAELEALAQMAAANWTPPDPEVLAFYRLTAAALLDAGAPRWLYVGYLDGEPVATAEATVQARTVGLFNIGTRESFRGRGIGSTMTWQPLNDAAAAGCDLAVLQADEGAVGLYRRLGFEAFGVVTEYKPGQDARTD
jgi:ribosomal protein S18 acetylase RimI-like enzyme